MNGAPDASVIRPNKRHDERHGIPPIAAVAEVFRGSACLTARNGLQTVVGGKLSPQRGRCGRERMKRSNGRILTTHVGSLIRPARFAGFSARQASRQALRRGSLRDLPAAIRRRRRAPAGRSRDRRRQRRRVRQIDQLVAIRAGAALRLRAAADHSQAAIPSRAASTASNSPNSTPSSMRARVSRPRSKRSASGRSAIPARPSLRATSPISKRRSRTRRSKKRSCRWRRRQASFRIARTNITRARRS